jgi:hypothetical protein
MQSQEAVEGAETVQHGSVLRLRRGKRTRPKAARLAPDQLDEGATERLFDGGSDEDVVNGRHFADDGDDRSALLAANADVVLDLVDGHVPLIRYEWRNQAGDTMVVEAAWPFDSSQTAQFGAPDIHLSGGHDGRRSRAPVDRSGPRTERSFARGID